MRVFDRERERKRERERHTEWTRLAFLRGELKWLVGKELPVVLADKWLLMSGRVENWSPLLPIILFS